MDGLRCVAIGGDLGAEGEDHVGAITQFLVEPADHSTQHFSAGRKTAMILLSFVVFTIALAIGLIYGR